MVSRGLYIICLLVLSNQTMAQRQLVVANVESKVPIRDVEVSTDDGKKLRTTWDGRFVMPDSVSRIDFHHPDFEKRYVLKSEIQGDTIFLIPNMNALREVVIYGERRFDKRIAQMLRPSERQKEDAKLPQVIPAGFNPIAFALWVYDLTFRKSVEERARRKKALKEVRKKEEAYQEQWEALEGKK